ncbi:MAG: CCA tRNA nucleotidyltransferase [Oscillatoria sp. PMC 1068.18]|nr:CCA tRNA nucleotidyltransferase [Oscillatoria sp. PMC 1076.18]MEC4989011.1 CCA tRNA nucleotidyltransferase [Oscillatoria sp. PMC 1068.18]
MSLPSADNFPFSLDLLPQPAYLVGGAVRDALLNRKRREFDFDFVLATQAVETASKIARLCQAGFVLLDDQRQIARVVFDEGTVDFALQEGDSLMADLQRRDYTINAIAYNPLKSEIIDPLQGQKDLQQGILRMVSVANLEDDPLRLLRAYRFAAQLNFTIEPTTRATIRRLNQLLPQVAAERVQTELNYLLAAPQAQIWLAAANEDNLLQFWFPQATSENFILIKKVNKAADKVVEKYPELANQLNVPVSGKSLSRLNLAKLACLVSPQPELAELQLIELKYSKAEIRTVTTALKYLPNLLPQTLREEYFWFQNLGDVFPTFAVLVLSRGRKIEQIANLIERYLNPEDLVAHPRPLVTGNDLISRLNLTPSPQIGKLLTEIQIARIEGKIVTAEDAIAFAKELGTGD